MQALMLLGCSQIRTVIKQQEVLHGAKKIGKGFFSGIYQGKNDKTVLKLSFCGVSYDFLKTKSANKHFPKIINDFGKVGTYTVGQGRKSCHLYKVIEFDTPLYLYEIEKLEKLNTANKKFIGLLCNTIYKFWDEFAEINKEKKRKNIKENSFEYSFKRLLETDILDGRDEFKQALMELLKYHKKGKGIIDISSQNFMQRNDGTIVFIDPFCDKVIFDKVYQSPDK